jgi:adenylylsulfate kinase
MQNRNIVKHVGIINSREREELMGHKSFLVWFTGLSGSGKSTIAHNLEALLVRKGKHAYVLDGDNVRHGINQDLGFTPEDRVENIRRIGEVSCLFADAGLIVLSAFISPYRKERAMVRSLFQTDSFIEVYVKCPVSECENRDVKGLYKKAREGKISDFTGISAPYEEPDEAEIVIDTRELTIEESVNKVYVYLEKQGLI